LTVQFSSAGSFDQDTNDVISLSWSFFGDGTTNSTSPSPSFTYTSNGNYSDHGYDLPAGLSASAFRDTVFTERRKEFIQESQRWYDLVRRTDLGPGQYYLRAVQSMYGNPKAAASLKDTLFPIPQTEIDLYGGRNPNFKQNPGW